MKHKYYALKYYDQNRIVQFKGTNKVDAVEQFKQENLANIQAMTEDSETHRLGHEFIDKITQYQYIYHFTWMGHPII